MKRIVLVNGVIAGLMVSGILILTHFMVEDGTIGYDNARLVGYASMVLAFSMIFAGIKKYRDELWNGIISFGQAVKVGLLITVVASVIYAVTWDIYYQGAASDFSEKYAAHYLEKMRKEGATQEEIASMQTEMEAFNEMYENTFIRFGITLIEILPVGLIITLISALMLKRAGSRPSR